MKSEAALILDSGTSSLKGALFEGGRRLAFVRLPYEGERRPDFENRSLQTLLKTAVRAVAALRGRCPSAAIRSVVTVGNGPSWVAFDGGGAVCGAPLMWTAAGKTQAPPTSSRYLRLLDAFSRLHPDVFRRAQAFLPLSDAFAYFLTGERAAALSCEAARFLYWEEEECRRLGLPFEKLPPFALSGERLGTVTREAAAATGIDAGAAVYAGAPDYVAGLIGSGSLRPGAVFNRTGTSEAVNFVLDTAEGGAPFWDGFNVDSVFQRAAHRAARRAHRGAAHLRFHPDQLFRHDRRQSGGSGRLGCRKRKALRFAVADSPLRCLRADGGRRAGRGCRKTRRRRVSVGSVFKGCPVTGRRLKKSDENKKRR